MYLAARRTTDGPRDVLVPYSIDSTGGIRVKVELAAARRFPACVIDLLTARRDNVKVDVAVSVPRERDLHIAGSDLGDARRKSNVRADSTRWAHPSKLQIELIEGNFLRKRQQNGRGCLRSGKPHLIVPLDASSGFPHEAEGPSTDEQEDTGNRRVACNGHCQRAAVHDALIAGSRDSRSGP